MSRPDAISSAPRRPRATLSRELVVDAAIEVLDADGLDGLTMRAVAHRLDAGAMSLYRHVDGRDELLDLVVARLLGEAVTGARTGKWRADLTALALELRAVLLRRPQLTVLLTSRAASAGGGLAGLDHALGILRDAGLGPRDAARANHALGNYVAGAALWEAVGLDGSTGEERQRRAAAAAEAIRGLPPDEAPNVAWAADELFAGSAEDRFRYGLERLLDGFEARLSPATRSSA